MAPPGGVNLTALDEEIPDDLLEAVGIAHGGFADVFEIGLERDSLGFGGVADDIDGGVDDGAKIAGPDIELELAGDDAGDVEDFVNELGLDFGVAVDDFDAFADIFGRGIGGFEDAGPADDGVEGGADFVGKGGEEEVLGAAGGFGLAAECGFAGEEGFAFALEGLALGDVADAALDDFAGVFIVEVGDEFDVALRTVLGFEDQVVVADLTGVLQVTEHIVAGGFVGKDAKLPEFPADHFLAGIAGEFGHELVGIGDAAFDGVEDKDAIECGENAAVAEFGAAEVFLNVTAFGEVVKAQEDARDAVELAGVEQHGAAADLLKLVGDLDIFKAAAAGQDFFEEAAELGDIPLAIAQFKDQFIVGLGGGDFEMGEEGLIGGAAPGDLYRGSTAGGHCRRWPGRNRGRLWHRARCV